MVSEERTWYLYRGRGLLEVAGPIGRGQQVVSGSEWVSRCGGERYKRSVFRRGRFIVYCVVVSFFFEDGTDRVLRNVGILRF